MSSNLTPDLSTELAGVRLANPVMTASGTSGYGPEYASYIDINALGAFVTKSVTLHERAGNPHPRTVETASGMLNAIGLANVGLERFIVEKVPFLADLDVPVVVNVAGHNLDDYCTVCQRLDEIDCLDILELNVSCPNVDDGLEWGTQPDRLERLIAAVRPLVRRCRLMVKLTPNTSDVAALARAAINAGADILSMINTLRGMAIHADTRRPLLANVSGGLSGPAIKPVALYMVHEVYRKVARELNVPIVGMGGIRTWRDAVEFMLAGATAVAVGTASFQDPRLLPAVVEGIAAYLASHGERRVTDITGRVVLPTR